MTITPERLEVVDFTVPYYFTPAQVAASTESGITTLEGMAGQTICAGEGTTYFHWLQGNLDFGPGGRPDPPPAGVTATTLPTDRDCALAWQSGRHDFAGWVSAAPTIDEAIADGLPLIKVGDPVYSEPLAVAADKSGPDPTDLLARLSAKIAEMNRSSRSTLASLTRALATALSRSLTRIGAAAFCVKRSSSSATAAFLPRTMLHTVRALRTEIR
jgi:polar amino acid transport system substrate-binding protein